MKITEITKNIKHLSHGTDKGEYFTKQIVDLGLDGINEKIFQWFSPGNNYPETVINAIRQGTTLESILFEDLIYKTGSGFNTDDNEFSNYLNKDIVNPNNETFKSIFKESNDHFNKLGNIFIDLIFTDDFQLVSQAIIQPQKVRLLKDKKNVWLFNDWTKFNKNDATKFPLYPNVKKFKIDGITFLKSVYHIKNKVLGFDHYGINDKMIEALLLNEKEHRRNNWQLSQIKNGFKKDFFLVTEFPLNEKEKDKLDLAFKNSSGDDNAGGVETIEGEGAKLVPANSDYQFDFTKDDTSEQLFLKMGFPRSLIGIKSGGTFSVEQVESDYDQYLPKVEEQQEFMIGKFNVIFKEHTNFSADWNVINTPPSVILQNYMQYMNDEQKNIVIGKVFQRYGLDTNNNNNAKKHN